MGPGALRAIQISLPPPVKTVRDAAEQFLLSLSYCEFPLSFEVVGLPEATTVQIVAAEEDYLQVRQQLKAYFPEATPVGNPDPLRALRNEMEAKETVVVDFGLSQEFMRPLRTYDRFETDPLIGVVGALTELGDGELGMLQILFKKRATRGQRAACVRSRTLTAEPSLPMRRRWCLSPKGKSPSLSSPQSSAWSRRVQPMDEPGDREDARGAAQAVFRPAEQ